MPIPGAEVARLPRNRQLAGCRCLLREVLKPPALPHRQLMGSPTFFGVKDVDEAPLRGSVRPLPSVATI